jgi:hypothetical protein
MPPRDRDETEAPELSDGAEGVGDDAEDPLDAERAGPVWKGEVDGAAAAVEAACLDDALDAPAFPRARWRLASER